MKKAQAAMEFLMTYGWAILVVLVAIAALAYFGVLNPGRFLPESCIIGSGFSCDEFKVNAAGTATIIVRNSIGDQITLANLSIEGRTDTEGAVTIADGATYTFTFTGLTAATAGTKYSQDITFSYTKGGLSHSKTGKLSTKYE